MDGAARPDTLATQRLFDNRTHCFRTTEPSMTGCAPVIGSGMPTNVSPGCITKVPRTRWTPGAQQNTRSGPGLSTNARTWDVDNETGTTIPLLGQIVEPAARSCAPPTAGST